LHRRPLAGEPSIIQLFCAHERRPRIIELAATAARPPRVRQVVARVLAVNERQRTLYAELQRSATEREELAQARIRAEEKASKLKNVRGGPPPPHPPPAALSVGPPPSGKRALSSAPMFITPIA
jgi:hypothetical protein